VEAAELTSLGELAALFVRLGATAFGGPAAHIAMMQDEVVTRRRWLSEERFLDLLGATNLIPEMAIHIGWARRRWSGLVVAGVAFIAPAMLTRGSTSASTQCPLWPGCSTLPSLFWVFLKTGSVLFGSGYVLLAFLRADLVERLGWLTESQLMDAIAVGQITPGR
jgi:chromate transporter